MKPLVNSGGESFDGGTTYRECHKVIIEAKATGDPLIRDLRLAGIQAIGYQPKGDKESRVQRISHLLEGGYVFLPTSLKDTEKLLPWADEFIDHTILFPNAESNDYVDSMSQALQYLIDGKALYINKIKV